MRNGLRLLRATSTLVVLYAAGCVSDSAFDLAGENSSTAEPATSARSGLESGGIWGRDTTSVSSATPSTAASPTESVTKVLHQVRASISEALDIQPERTPASDPTRLTDTPAKLSPRVYVRAAAWAEDQDAPHIAKTQYEKALELDPDNATALVAYARFEDRQGNSNEALKLYQRALAAAPQSQVVLNDLGIFHARRRDFDASLGYLETAVQLAPENVRYRNNMAGVLVMSGRPEDAVPVLKAVHTEAIAQLNVGHFLYMEKEIGAAATYFQRASELDPSLVAARDMLHRIERGKARTAQPVAEATPAEATPAEPEAPDPGPYRLSSVSRLSKREEQSDDSETLSTNGVQSEAGNSYDRPRRLPKVD